MGLLELSSSRRANTVKHPASVAVVVPIFRPDLTPDEAISLSHLQTFLTDYDKMLLAPEHLSVNYEGFEVRRFEDHFFQGVDTYSHLLLSAPFYEAFQHYDFILIYQLDALVFSDQLQQWCQADYDYLGAPWLRSPDMPSRGFSRCGNGGLSLRKVSTALEVIRSRRYSVERVPFWRELFTTSLQDVQEAFSGPRRLLKRLRVLRQIRRGVAWYTDNYSLNEDHFWSDRARLFYPGFRVASVEAGLRFSFEREPRYCFERNDRQLPFGCHAWAKWDREFWEPFLLN